jgi:hypothetical protein
MMPSMESASNNPQTNKLHAGLDESAVAKAIQKSGYPLQTIISNKLRPTFYVKEEWSFIDRDTNTLRTLDILAERKLFPDSPNSARVRPTLDLLIECKKSELPYVFFLTGARPWISSFPLFCGLRKNSITAATDSNFVTWILPISQALGLENEPFISSSVACCMTFSKCVRASGKEIELSGEDPFRSLVLPMTKALQHFEKSEEPRETHQYHDCHLTLGVAVLDAPMIAANIGQDGAPSLELTPWIRVVRHEARENEDDTERHKSFAIDVVHKDFFDSFISDHILPFAERFSQLAIEHHVELASGQAFLAGKPTSGIDIETRLKPVVTGA